jgi:hypothetical protein
MNGVQLAGPGVQTVTGLETTAVRGLFVDCGWS